MDEPAPSGGSLDLLEGAGGTLAQANQRFRALVEASPTPLLLSRVRDGVILYANDRLETLVGLPPGSLVGKQTPDFYHDPADRPQIMATVRDQGYVRDMELRIRRADGTPRWVSLTVQRMIFDGEPTLATSIVDMTERKLTEQALRSSEETYRGLFDTLTELVYIQDLQGRFVNVNEAVVRAYGYPREEVVGQTPDLLAAPGTVDPEAFAATFARAVAGEPQRFEWWGRRKDGSIFPKDVSIQRSTYFGQDVVIAVARDISERKEAEAALRRSEEHFRRLIENASDIITIVDAEGFIRYQSPALTRILGYAQDELNGCHVSELLAPHEVGPTLSQLKRVAERPGSSLKAEFRFRHSDGTWRVLEGIGTTISPTSAEEGVVVNSRDVTERKEAEAALRLQKTLLEAEGEASPDGILVVSEAGRILSYNQRFVEMWGVPPGIVAARSDAEVLRLVEDQLLDPDAFRARVAELYGRPQERARDEIVLRDGRVLDRYSAPVVSSEGEYYGRIWFFRDVTAEKRHAAELEAARQEAERAREQASQYAASLEHSLDELRAAQARLVHQEKLASLGRLTAGIAHEIKNPLNFVNNFAGLQEELAEELLTAAADPNARLADVQDVLADLRANAAKVHEHGGRVDAIVSAMMEHARAGTDERTAPRRPMDLNAFVEDQLGLALEQAQRRVPGLAVEVRRTYGADVGDVLAAPQELGRIVQGLLANAFDAIEERAGGDAAYAPAVTVETRREGAAVVLTVADNGTGIADHEGRRQRAHRAGALARARDRGDGLRRAAGRGERARRGRHVHAHPADPGDSHVLTRLTGAGRDRAPPFRRGYGERA